MKVLVVESDDRSKGEKVWQAYFGQGPYAPERAGALAREVECVRPPDSEKHRMSGVE